MSLRARIILSYILIVAGSFSLILHLVTNDIKPRYRESVEDSIVDTAELLAALLAGQIDNGRLELDNLDAAMDALAARRFSARIYDVVKQQVNLRIYVTDRNGLVLYDSTGQAAPGTDYSRWRDVFLTLRGRYGARTTRTVLDDPTSSTLYVAAPILKDGELCGVVTVGKPQDGIAAFITMAQTKLRWAMVWVGLVALGLAVLLSVWITWPIRKLTAYVRAVREGRTVPMPRLGSSEIGALGRAIAAMQTQLEGKNYIEDYVRALTHEMKSPLTGIKGAGEILRDHVASEEGIKFLDNIEADVERLHSLVERMLQLSRLENVRTITKTAIPAKPFFQELADAFMPRLAARDITVKLEVPEALRLHGDAFLLRQAVGNLIDNALDFSPAGSCITVTVAAGPELTISVRDQGVGMPDFAMDKAFDKFFSLHRPGTGKKSSGLGLPFVKEVAVLHGGTVRLRNTDPGLEAVISLPL